MATVRTYRDLLVWQKAMDLVTTVYAFTATLPPNEKFGLVTQMQRAATSIPSNIAEGRTRFTKPDFCKFLQIAFSSGAELETQLEICKRLLIGDEKLHHQAIQLLTEVQKILNVMLSKLRL